MVSMRMKKKRRRRWKRERRRTYLAWILVSQTLPAYLQGQNSYISRPTKYTYKANKRRNRKYWRWAYIINKEKVNWHTWGRGASLGSFPPLSLFRFSISVNILDSCCNNNKNNGSINVWNHIIAIDTVQQVTSSIESTASMALMILIPIISRLSSRWSSSSTSNSSSSSLLLLLDIVFEEDFFLPSSPFLITS